MSRTDDELIADALEHLVVLRQHLCRGGLNDQTIADAVCLRLAAALDTMASATPELRERAFGTEWQVMWATRNRIVHGYALIDISIVAATVEHDLLWFEDRLRLEAGRFSGPLDRD